MPLKRILIALMIFFMGLLLFYPKSVEFKKGPSVPESEIFQGVSYETLDAKRFEVGILLNNLFSPTRIKITPDGKHMLISQITGDVLAIDKTSEGWTKDPYLVTKVETRFPGFPPDEAGLTGMIFSNEFKNNGKLFLLYSYKDKDGKVKNRISVTSLTEKGARLRGSTPKQIFQANIVGNPSHQITDGVSLDVDGQPQILFLIGEGFDASRAQDPNLEAGKLILMREDGSERKIVALGIRNGYVLAKNPQDNDGKILISDTGPDKYDRLIYTNPLMAVRPNFGWNGNQEALAKPIPDPNFKIVTDMVILRLPETRTFTGLAFEKSGSILATLFGKTGSKENSPGKEILLGKLTNLAGQPRISFEEIIKRSAKANGKLGNPIGLEVDQKSNDFFFADIIEGRIYQAKQKGGD